jgi:hypothetical protein
MKKIIFAMVFMIGAVASAQLNPVLKNKRGILILPQKGQYCLGLSANPFLSYFGNLVNGSTNNPSPSAQFISNGMIYGKYMKTNDYAYRASFRFGINSNSTSIMVADATPGATLDAKVEDVYTTNSTVLGLGFGFEKRKGSTRLQGIYGLEGLITYNSGNNMKYKLGNQLQNLDTGTIVVTQRKDGSVFRVGARAFVGVEYFFAPQISIGAEFGYGIGFGLRGEANETREYYNFSNNSNQKDVIPYVNKGKTFSLDTDNQGGVLKLLFYF